MSPERYAVNAMYEAIGALRALTRDDDNLSHVIRKLEIGIEKIGGEEECNHDWDGGLDPSGGISARCKKCGTKRHVNNMK